MAVPFPLFRTATPRPAVQFDREGGTAVDFASHAFVVAFDYAAHDRETHAGALERFMRVQALEHARSIRQGRCCAVYSRPGDVARVCNNTL